MVDLYLLLQHLHGLWAALAVAALLHPAVRHLPKGPLPRGHRLSLGLSLLAIWLTFGLGLFIYPSYRVAVKPARLWQAPWAANLFESKEHIAWYVVVLATLGTGLAVGTSARRLAQQCFMAAFALGLWVLVAGLSVSAVKIK